MFYKLLAHAGHNHSESSSLTNTEIMLAGAGSILLAAAIAIFTD